MLSGLNLLGTPEQSIVLETRLGNRVLNAQSAGPDQNARGMFNLHCKNHPRWEIRKDPCGIYNCYGHVWGSRRTAIFSSAEIKKIIQDDGYRLLPVDEKPQRGDLILYYFLEGPDPLAHVGLVCELRYPLDDKGGTAGKSAPWILSKLNTDSGEVIHHYDDPVYGKGSYRYEFWTDR